MVSSEDGHFSWPKLFDPYNSQNPRRGDSDEYCTLPLISKISGATQHFKIGGVCTCVEGEGASLNPWILPEMLYLRAVRAPLPVWIPC